MNVNIILGLMNIGSALLIILVSIPLIKRKIKMNGLYGVRIKKSYESNENWYSINAYGGKQLAIWSIPMIIAGLVCFLVPINDPNQILLPLLMGVGPITICIIIALIRIMAYAKKL
jgi:hypothetical protein